MIRKDCARYDHLLDRAEKEVLSEEDIEFMLHHHLDCTGIHSDAAIEQRQGWAAGTLRNWNGRDPLPESGEMNDCIRRVLTKVGDRV
jgi:hypothetical protein